MDCQTKNKPKRLITDKEFQEALDDPEIARKLRKQTAKYAASLGEDERKELGLIALWKALQDFRPEFKQKFTTSLHRFINWECLRRLRSMRRKRSRENVLDVDIRDIEHKVLNKRIENNDLKMLVKEKLEMLPLNVRNTITQYHFENRTIDEISKRDSCTKESVRKRLQYGISRLAELLNGVNPLGGM
jgi:RNA polymerase sigma factor (sigma-70 family)